MDSGPSDYLLVVRRHCGRFIAGPTVSATGLIGAFVAWERGADPLVVKLIAWTSVGLLVLSVVLAQYRAWEEERELREKEVGEERAKREAEEAKNQGAEIVGEIPQFNQHGNIGAGHTYGNWAVDADCVFDVYLLNRRPRTTNLQSIELDGSALQPQVQFSSTDLAGNKGLLLQDGRGITVHHVKVAATINGFHDSRDVPVISLDQLKAWVTDGFLHKHPLAIKGGEYLSL